MLSAPGDAVDEDVATGAQSRMRSLSSKVPIENFEVVREVTCDGREFVDCEDELDDAAGS